MDDHPAPVVERPSDATTWGIGAALQMRNACHAWLLKHCPEYARDHARNMERSQRAVAARRAKA